MPKKNKRSGDEDIGTAYVGVRIPRVDLEALQESAADERTSQSAWIRKAILDRLRSEAEAVR